MENEPGNGDLAFFCPACPQPGVNIPNNWMDAPNKYVSIVQDAVWASLSSQVVVQAQLGG
jgi:hypothetical protein